MEDNTTSEISMAVKFRFSGKYPKNRVKELMGKVAEALYHEYSSGNGYVPEDGGGEVLTDGVTIECEGHSITDNYYDKRVKGRYVTES